MDDMDQHLPLKFREIAIATQQDTVMKQVLGYVCDGCLQSRHIKCEGRRKFYPIRDSLSTTGNAITYRDRIVIPACQRAQVLMSLHNTHQGIGRTKALVRGYVYWPGIDANIEAMIQKCRPCAEAAKNPAKGLLSTWPTPNEPWERTHIDYAAGPLHGKWFLVFVDAFSKWPEEWMMTTTTSATLEKLIVSDNGPQFVSEECKRFSVTNNTIHLNTAPYHPMSNGLAERFVDTLMRAISKHGS